MIERSEDGQLAFGSGEQHVEATMSIGAVDGAEVLVKYAFGRPAIYGGDEDDVALVALNVFEILDEEFFEITTPFLPVSLNIRIRGRFFIHQCFDQIALRLIHRDDSAGPVGPLPHECGSLLD